MKKILMFIAIAAMAVGCSKNDVTTASNGEREGTLIGISAVHEQDSLALAALYKSTKGESWAKWLKNWSNTPVQNREGIELEKIDGVQRVVSIRMRGFGLNGTIPAEIGNLTELRTLDVSFNDNLQGTIPEEIYTLKNLITLNLSYTAITGELSGEVANLQKLDTLTLRKGALDLGGERFSGTIPTELSKMKVLRYLNLECNSFTGSIPSELAGMTALTDLRLWKNKLTGEIPAEIGNLNNLVYLILAENNLEGEIPAELANLKNLSDLHLNNNNFTGTIPAALGTMTALSYLDLGSNKLTGEIPVEIANLEKLGIFRANDNQLTGEFPKGLCNKNPMLVDVCLQNNNLTGEIPVLKGFHIGTIPQPWYCSVKLYGNRMTGDIPAWILQFPSDCQKNLVPQQGGFGFTNEELIK